VSAASLGPMPTSVAMNARLVVGCRPSIHGNTAAGYPPTVFQSRPVSSAIGAGVGKPWAATLAT
jgi:hypothetical protein